MPLTSKGKKIKAAMQKEYGKKAGEKVFYATAQRSEQGSLENKGTIKGVTKPRRKDK
jgi:hypothetical protein